MAATESVKKNASFGKHCFQVSPTRLIDAYRTEHVVWWIRLDSALVGEKASDRIKLVLPDSKCFRGMKNIFKTRFLDIDYNICLQLISSLDVHFSNTCLETCFACTEPALRVRPVVAKITEHLRMGPGVVTTDI